MQIRSLTGGPQPQFTVGMCYYNYLRLMDNQKLQVLLDKNVPYDANKVALLDEVTIGTSSSDPMQINQANNVLRLLNDDPEFWLQIDKIMTLSQNPRTKFFALVILQSAIKQKWMALQPQQRQSVKVYIVHLVVQYAESTNLNKETENILHKANSILVEILKYEWNTTWTNFIDEICESSKSNMNVCQNNFLILKLLSEEIFDFSKNQITKQQIETLKNQMNSQFTSIFTLCELVLGNAQKLKPQLIKACLDTLHSFLSWIPTVYIHFSDIIDKLTVFLNNDYLRLSALNCLIEIGSIPLEINMERIDDAKTKVFNMFTNALNSFSSIIPLNEDIVTLRQLKFKSNPANFDITCKEIALFLTSILKEQSSWLLQNSNELVISAVKISFKHLVQLLRLPDEQTFKILIEFFHHLTKVIFPLLFPIPEAAKIAPFAWNAIPHLYREYLMEVRNIVCLHMVKPQEVLIVIDQTGTPVKQDLTNTENNTFYDTVVELLVALTRMDWPGTRQYIISKIQSQQNENEFRFDVINSLSWAVGALSGNLPEGQDKPFLIFVLKILLHLCDVKKGKPIKAVIASCIMFIVGQYPEFLRNNWNFLKTVIKKLFQFMKERYQGVMDMACNTFLKICKLVQDQFLVAHESDNQPFINTLIRWIPEQTSSLETSNQVMSFYESIAHVIAAEPDQAVKLVYMKQTLGSFLVDFNGIIETVKSNSALLQEEDIEQRISNFLKINQIMAGTVGLSYGALLIQLNSYLNNIYQYYSKSMNESVIKGGPNTLNFVNIKRMRNINKQIMRLYKVYISACGDNLNQDEITSIKNSFVLPLYPLLELYSTSIQQLKDPEFISLYTAVFEKLHSVMTPDLVSAVMETIFGSTLSMITKDFNSYPEIRQTFFEFLKSIIKFNFEQFYNMPGDNFNTSLNCVVWSFKHHLNTFSDLGLELLLEIFNSMNSNSQIANAFYPKYYLNLLKDLLQVMTDGYHKSGFKLQSKLLFILVQVVTKQYVVQKLDSNQATSNAEYVYNYLLNILSTTFTNVSKVQTTEILTNMFSTNDQRHFRELLRDYLILINRFASVESEQQQAV